MHRIAGALAAFVLCAAPFAVPPESSATEQGRSLVRQNTFFGTTTLRYPADPAPQRATFRDTGCLDLEVPQQPNTAAGRLRVCGNETDVLASRNVETLDANGTVVATNVDSSISLEGHVVGAADSHAILLIGEYGIYGTVEARWPDGRHSTYDFDPVETPQGSGHFVQDVKAHA